MTPTDASGSSGGDHQSVLPEDSSRLIVVPAIDRADLIERSTELARSLGTDSLGPDAMVPQNNDVVLVVDVDRIRLCDYSGRRPVCIDVDFVAGRTGFRRHSRPSIREPLFRAVGRPGGIRDVFDATMGLARDAFLLACVGCRVRGVERSPVLVALVQDGLDRARLRSDPTLQEIIGRMSVTQRDARAVLLALSADERPETVYMDPMYPPSGKSALPQKDMRFCRRLVGDDPDAGALLDVARQVARRRVVVKRSPHAPALGDAPTITFRGRKVRYDVYLIDGTKRKKS